MTREFETGATRDSDDGKLDYEGFLSPLVLECFAKYMHEYRLRNVPSGSTIRASDNWQKGMPKSAYMKSLLRHVFEAWKQWRTTGGVDLDVMNAILFNVQGFMHECLKYKVTLTTTAWVTNNPVLPSSESITVYDVPGTPTDAGK